MGFEEKLNNLIKDEDLDVRDRAKTAINHFATDNQTPNYFLNLSPFQSQDMEITHDESLNEANEQSPGYSP